jgi:hypothetical protein
MIALRVPEAVFAARQKENRWNFDSLTYALKEGN